MKRNRLLLLLLALTLPSMGTTTPSALADTPVGLAGIVHADATPAAGAELKGNAPAWVADPECEWWCKEETNENNPPGRVCVIGGDPGGGASGPWEACDTKDGIAELCELFYGVEHCHECDITPGDCEGGGTQPGGGQDVLAAFVSPTGTLIARAGALLARSPDGVLRVPCSGRVVGYDLAADRTPVRALQGDIRL